jgi:hypothetical protein
LEIFVSFKKNASGRIKQSLFKISENKTIRSLLQSLINDVYFQINNQKQISATALKE